MRRRTGIQLVVPLAILLTAPAAAPAQWSVDGNVAETSAAQASKDGFAAYIAVVPNPSRLIEEWAQAPPGPVPKVALLEEVAPEEDFGVVLLLGGCPPGGCTTSTQFSIYAPDGSLYKRSTGKMLDAGAVSPDGRTFLSSTVMRELFLQRDAKGPYRIVATVTDLSRDITLTVQTTVALQ